MTETAERPSLELYGTDIWKIKENTKRMTAAS